MVTDYTEAGVVLSEKGNLDAVRTREPNAKCVRITRLKQPFSRKMAGY